MNKGSNLDVLPVQPIEVEKTKNIHETLPQIDRNKGFLLLLLGSVNSGKSTVIANLLLNKHMYGGKESAFDGGTFVFSPSIELDDTMRFVREHCECYSEYKPEYLKMIKDRQMEYEKKKRPKSAQERKIGRHSANMAPAWPPSISIFGTPPPLVRKCSMLIQA